MTVTSGLGTWRCRWAVGCLPGPVELFWSLAGAARSWMDGLIGTGGCQNASILKKDEAADPGAMPLESPQFGSIRQIEHDHGGFHRPGANGDLAAIG